MKIFGMGGLEFVIILVVILLIFGPKNLPKLGSAFGKTISNLRAGMNEGKKKEVEAEEATEEPKATDPVAKLAAETENLTGQAQARAEEAQAQFEEKKADVAQAAEEAVAEAAAAVDEAFEEAVDDAPKKVKRVVRKKVVDEQPEEQSEEQAEEQAE